MFNDIGVVLCYPGRLLVAGCEMDSRVYEIGDSPWLKSMHHWFVLMFLVISIVATLTL